MRLAAIVSTLLAAATAGCGGDFSFTSSTDDGTSRGGVTFEDTLVVKAAALVTTDVDGDGRADLVAVDRSGTGDVKCWSNLGDGTYADATAAWASAPVVGAVKGSCDVLDDAELAGDLGVHTVAGGKTGTTPYVLMHLGAGAAAATGPPTVDAIEPASGPGNGLAWLSGSDLAAPDEPPAVTFSTASADVLLAFADYVLVVVPEGLPLGPVDVVLTRGGATSTPVAFTVTPATAPALASVGPSAVEVGTIAVLRGTDLGTPFDDVEASFAGTRAEHVVSFLTVAFAVVPAGAVSGPVTLTVNGVESNAVHVEVGTLPAPSITALVPAAASPGSLVRIEGTDLLVLGEWVDVSFAGAPAAVFSLDGSSVTAVVPPGAADGDVVVRVGGRSSAGATFDVTTRGAPHVDALSPSSGSPGDAVEVAGTDLHDLSSWSRGSVPGLPLFGDLRVTVGGKDAWLVVPTVEGLVFWVPFGAASGDVVVRVNGVASGPVPFAVD
jgi:hypothetical protein